MGLPALAWPIGITPEDCRIYAERPEPVVLPEELVLQEHYQMRMFGKLNPRYVGPFKVVARVGSIAYKLDLSEELSRVHNTFHVSNLKKCYANEPLAVPLNGLHFDDKLQFMEEPIEIMNREVKRLRNSHVPIVKVQWNSRRGPEFTWEREDQFKKKYPHLFTKTAPSLSAALAGEENSSHKKIESLSSKKTKEMSKQKPEYVMDMVNGVCSACGLGVKEGRPQRRATTFCSCQTMFCCSLLVLDTETTRVRLAKAKVKGIITQLADIILHDFKEPKDSILS
nr:putative reverse transcriptase domain-containing protein [Tanacetum cinerariifolium]